VAQGGLDDDGAQAGAFQEALDLEHLGWPGTAQVPAAEGGKIVEDAELDLDVTSGRRATAAR